MSTIDETNSAGHRIEEDERRVKADEIRLEEDVARLEHDAVDAERVCVDVNCTRVILPSHLVSGLEIKQAAINQGATLEIDFQLWRLTGEHSRVQIANDEKIRPREGERFAATTPDDNA